MLDFYNNLVQPEMKYFFYDNLFFRKKKQKLFYAATQK